jgi:chemotaxis protein MotB
MATIDETPVRKVVIKKGHGGGHHGGAWKVAYADFVTTMMALFIVLWITGQSDSVKQAVARYFRHPSIFRSGDAGALMSGGAGIMPGDTGEKGGEVDHGPGGESDAAREERALQTAAVELKDQLASAALLATVRDQVEIHVTPEGLRVELIEREGSPFFKIGSAVVIPPMQPLLETLTKVFVTLPNHITVEGHTDSRQYSTSQQYGNWELSSDRANSARRIMETAGARPGQIDRVVGYADRVLRVPENPMNASNRRITLIVRRQAQVGAAPALAPSPATAAPPSAGAHPG